MALFKSDRLTSVSGSIGGTTFSRSRSGLYFRARAVPVNPNTTQQTAVKAALTSAVAEWSTALSNADRNDWEVFGQNVLMTNALGDPFAASGQNWFSRTQVPLIQANDPIYTALQGLPVGPALPTNYRLAPTTFATADPGVWAIDTAAGTAIDVSWQGGEWFAEDNGLALVYLSRPRSPARRYFGGPWRLLAAIPGDSLSPPTSPQTLNTAVVGYTYAPGQLARIRVIVYRPNQGPSSPVQSGDFVWG